MGYPQKKSPILKPPLAQEILTEGGIFFALPKTLLRLEVLIRVVEKKRGVFSPFTSKYFNVSDYIKADSREYFIKDVRITPVSVPDENQIFFFSTRHARGISLQVDEKGILRSINANTSYDSKSKTFLPSENKGGSDPSTLPAFIQPRFSYKSDTVINRELSKDSTIIERRFITKKLVEKSLEEYAREAYDKLQDIRKRKYDFLSDPSELNLDGAGLSLLLSELDKMEKNILESFFGTTQTTEKLVGFYFEPGKEREQPVFNFTRDKGIQFNTKDIRGIETAVLEVKFQPGFWQSVPPPDPKKKTKNGKAPRLPFRIPVQARVRLVQDESLLYEGDIVLPQLGPVGFVTVEDLRKVRMTYDTATGALLSLDFAR
ncbi:MAG: DUF4831 family protein [Flavobacteriales bacterium]|nr:DUF4831 family protein [Flavobacteriales bacterium]MDW8433008.1 DUF4831 family protein [Flavobacteriales bacterium]